MMRQELPVLDATSRRLVTGWVWLGVYSLLAAGLLALLLGLSRTPVIQNMMPGSNFFRIALVVHVDLSVVIWALVCAGMLWSVYARPSPGFLNRLAFYLCVSGTVMISVSPFVGADQPLMSDYIPVLDHPWFMWALGIVSAGLAIQAIHFIFRSWPGSWAVDQYASERVALMAAAITAIVALGCIGFSRLGISEQITGKYYYDLLFWGAGHVLQFMHCLLMMVAWTVLANRCGNTVKVNSAGGASLFVLVVLPIVLVPWLYSYPIDSSEHIVGFTRLMRWGGLTCLPIGLWIAFKVLRPTVCGPELRPLRAALLSSITLFAAGGLMGFFIKGSNTMIPAHYHGSTVGVTLAFMGIIYLLLPEIGRPLRHLRLAYWQPFLYGGGQLLHITALAWSGGQGIKRKTAGAAQGLDSFSEVAGMAFMGLGNLVAVAGGLVFLWVVVSALVGSQGTGDRLKPVPASASPKDRL